MPDLLTHTLFARNVLARIDQVKIAQLIEEKKNLFQLGAQGPDFFFYYKPWSLFNKRITSIGGEMHDYFTSQFFIDGFLLIKEKGIEEKQNLLVYLLGFLCHYYLDKNAHPYVNYIEKTGIWDFDGGVHEFSHYNLEYTMDIRLWGKYENQRAIDIDESLLLKTDDFDDSITSYIKNYVNTYNKKLVSLKEIHKAYINMMAILHILYDPNYQKKLLRKIPAPRKFYTNNPFSNFDVLNSKHRPWHYLGEEKLRTDSMEDIMSTAANECLNVMLKLFDYLTKDTQIDIKTLIPNVSYNTNRKVIKP
ncbi:MAG: zinc dependent phospholipase C family protein [Clostridiales bacterium]|nr:zinc dependent phospholipase C family protein [Clostridiales bacterium]